VTLVLMADGSTKQIEDVEVGDWVVAADPDTGEQGPRRVTDVIVGDGTKHLVELTIDGDTITATDRHPFWLTDDATWVDAEDLEPGDRLLLADGSTVAIDAIREYTVRAVVHNLAVDDLHTYYVVVDDAGVLVHNCTVGRHRDMPAPRPTGLESHHGVNSVWMEANVPGYSALDAPAVLISQASHNATRGVFNRWRVEIAARQGVPPAVCGRGHAD
jgi:pretoxin HINT domain-containing protein/HNH/endonuclease VII toxin of polymorphic toxin system component